MSRVFLLFCLFSLFSCHYNEEKTTTRKSESFIEPKKNKVKKQFDKFEVVLIKGNPNGWGYQILKNGKAMIKQPSIPAIQGNNGFLNEKDALKTGEFVLTKIKKGIFPPIVSIEELDSLKVLP
jgi:hypothetical protein